MNLDLNGQITISVKDFEDLVSKYEKEKLNLDKKQEKFKNERQDYYNKLGRYIYYTFYDGYGQSVTASFKPNDDIVNAIEEREKEIKKLVKNNMENLMFEKSVFQFIKWKRLMKKINDKCTR